MNKSIRNKILATSFVLSFLFFVIQIVRAQWGEPGAAFPGGRPNPPLDTGGTSQLKTGSLSVGSVLDSEAVKLNSAAREIRFYAGGLNAGIRFFGGNLQYQNASGWANFSAGGGITSINNAVGPVVTLAGGSNVTVSNPPGSNVITISAQGNGFGDLTDVVATPNAGITVANSAGPQPSVGLNITDLITDCGTEASGKVWWDGGNQRLACGPDSSGGGGFWSLSGTSNNLINNNTGNVNIGFVDTRFSNKLYVDGPLVAKGTIYHKGLTAWSPAKIAVVNDSPNDDIYFVLEDTDGNIVSEYARFKENGTFGVGTASTDPNYKITTSGGGIKADSSVSNRPAGYFSNSASGGTALKVDSGITSLGAGGLGVAGPAVFSGSVTIGGVSRTSWPTGGTGGESLWTSSTQPSGATNIFYVGGNVGVGTVNPRTTFEVLGNVKIASPIGGSNSLEFGSGASDTYSGFMTPYTFSQPPSGDDACNGNVTNSYTCGTNENRT